MSRKWSNTNSKYCSICCKILNDCLTILWTLDVIVLSREYDKDTTKFRNVIKSFLKNKLSL